MKIRYKLFLYKFFTLPNNEGIGEKVMTAFLVISLLEGLNLVSLFNIFRAIHPIDLRDASRWLTFAVFFVPPLIVNFYFIYYRSNYKAILDAFQREEKGTLKYTLIYAAMSLALLLLTALLLSAPGIPSGNGAN